MLTFVKYTVSIYCSSGTDAARTSLNVQRRRRYAYFQKTLAFSDICPYNISMLSWNIALPQYQPPLVNLLKIGGVDARSLVEIKRRRIGYTLSIYFGVATTQISAYFQKILDIKIVGSTITQQLSNSRRKNRLCPHTRAAFFSQISFFSLISDVSGYVRKRNRLRIYPWHRPHNRYRLWNIFFKSFLAYSRKEEEGNYDSR